MGIGTALLWAAIIGGGSKLLGSGIQSVFTGIAGQRQLEATREANRIMNQQWKKEMKFEQEKWRDKKLANGMQMLNSHLKDHTGLRNNLINIWSGRRGGI